MTDAPLHFGAQPHERPGDDKAREARHQVLTTLLGAYTDGELPPETSSQIDAHLLGCARCRREVEMHGVLRARLGHEPTVVASAGLRERIVQQIAITAPERATPAATLPMAAWRRRGVQVAVAGLLCVTALASVVAGRATRADTPRLAAVSATAVPLFTQVLADYRRVTAGDLPGRARDLDAVRAAVPFAIEVLPGTSARLLAAWSTDLGGEPAAVLAYRWRDQLVLQYLIGEPAFFRYPGMRTPLAAGDLITSTSGEQGVVAWAAPESGVVLVGDVAPVELAALRVRGAGR
jgi:anti-sigma factor RsiW